MSRLPNFTNPLSEHLRTLEKFKSPLSELQRTLSQLAEPQRNFKIQLQEVFDDYQRFQKEQMFDFQDRMTKYNMGFQHEFLTLQSVIKKFGSQNSKIIKSFGGIKKAFELQNASVIADLTKSFGAIEKFKLHKQGLLSVLKTQQDFAEKFKSLAMQELDGEFTEDKFQVVNSILNEVERGIKYHIEANPETVTQIPIDQLLNYIGFLLNILFFIHSTLTDKSDEILQKTTENEITIEEGFEHLNTRLDSIAKLQDQLSLRVCTHGTRVYKRHKSTSTALAFVKSGQVVNVVSINSNFKSKKWIYVTYVDFEFGTPQAGWVMKKYFEKEDENYR